MRGVRTEPTPTLDRERLSEVADRLSEVLEYLEPTIEDAEWHVIAGARLVVWRLRREMNSALN